MRVDAGKQTQENIQKKTYMKEHKEDFIYEKKYIKIYRGKLLYEILYMRAYIGEREKKLFVVEIRRKSIYIRIYLSLYI